MAKTALAYQVGPLLYSPANNTGLTESIVTERFGKAYSLALCLEDTIRDDCVEEAENQLIQTLSDILDASARASFFIPKVFIRVRHPDQIMKLCYNFGKAHSLVTGFILPKFWTDNADSYIDAICQANRFTGKTVYAMPILESAAMIDLRTRHQLLYTLFDKLKMAEHFILNIRVGGNDLCHAFGFRRHADESIYQIRPVADILTDIITVFGRDYVISGPVWEYFDGPNWKEGLMHELQADRLTGFTAKTVIHPNQIAVVNAAYQVTESDYADACAILDWDPSNTSLVSGSAGHTRMNEYKTHANWAERILQLYETYGPAAQS